MLKNRKENDVHNNLDSLITVLTAFLSALFSFYLSNKKFNSSDKKEDRDYIMEQNDRLNREN